MEAFETVKVQAAAISVMLDVFQCLIELLFVRTTAAQFEFIDTKSDIIYTIKKEGSA
jgi:hypothetical protein